MSVEHIILIVSLMVCLTGIAIVWIISRRMHKTRSDSMLQLQEQWTQLVGQQDARWGQISETINTTLRDLNTTLSERLNQNQLLTQKMQTSVADRLDNAGRTTAEVKGQLGELVQATQTIIQVGSEVKKLQDILQRPAMRGSLGEWSLENLLGEVLPAEHFTMQYAFKNGVKVDALVHLAQGSIAIDAKFPLANFQEMLAEKDEAARAKRRRMFLKDVRSRIDEIADKYILPDEGTLDFALMYVPAENVYYETIVSGGEKETDINAYARSRKVILVSPNTLYGYLMVVVMGLKGLQIEKNAQLIRRQLSRLGTDFNQILSEITLMGKHLNNAHQKFDDSTRKLEQFRSRLEQLETMSSETAS